MDGLPEVVREKILIEDERDTPDHIIPWNLTSSDAINLAVVSVVQLYRFRRQLHEQCEEPSLLVLDTCIGTDVLWIKVALMQMCVLVVS